MTRIIENQIQVTEPVPLLAFEKAKAQQWRGARGNLHRRRNTLGIRNGDLQNPSRAGDLLYEFIQIWIRGQKKEQKYTRH
jgi:hypothetical protein